MRLSWRPCRSSLGNYDATSIEIAKHLKASLAGHRLRLVCIYVSEFQFPVCRSESYKGFRSSLSCQPITVEPESFPQETHTTAWTCSRRTLGVSRFCTTTGSTIRGAVLDSLASHTIAGAKRASPLLDQHSPGMLFCRDIKSN